MSKYFVIKRDSCGHCLKGYVNLTPEMVEAVNRGDMLIPVQLAPDHKFPDFRCPICNGKGYHEFQEPLLDVLAKVRFADAIFDNTKFYNLRIVEEGE